MLLLKRISVRWSRVRSNVTRFTRASSKFEKSGIARDVSQSVSSTVKDCYDRLFVTYLLISFFPKSRDFQPARCAWQRLDDVIYSYISRSLYRNIYDNMLFYSISFPFSLNIQIIKIIIICATRKLYNGLQRDNHIAEKRQQWVFSNRWEKIFTSFSFLNNNTQFKRSLTRFDNNISLCFWLISWIANVTIG